MKGLILMQVPLSKPDISSLEKKYVQEVLDSGQLSFGEKLTKFEDQFRHHFHSKFAVAMNSGTSALHVAVRALGLTKGDEVITTPYSFIASGNCLIYEGVQPVFVDIDPDTLNMDTNQIENKITVNTKAILAVHIFGQPSNMDQILFLAKKYNLFVIEDACEAIGAEWKGKPVGLLGDVGVFAFYPNKQITTGEGGILVTNQEHIFKLASSMRNQGRNMNGEWLNHDILGYNYRMSDLQAAVGLAQMERLTEILQKRENAARRYIQLIKDVQLPVQIPSILPDAKVSWFVFVIILPEHVDRTNLIHYLDNKGVQTKPYFPSIHLQPVYQRLFSYQLGDYPNSERMSDRSLAIPFYSNITAEEQEYVVRSLLSGIEREGIHED